MRPFFVQSESCAPSPGTAHKPHVSAGGSNEVRAHAVQHALQAFLQFSCIHTLFFSHSPDFAHGSHLAEVALLSQTLLADGDAPPHVAQLLAQLSVIHTVFFSHSPDFAHGSHFSSPALSTQLEVGRTVALSPDAGAGVGAAVDAPGHTSQLLAQLSVIQSLFLVH